MDYRHLCWVALSSVVLLTATGCGATTQVPDVGQEAPGVAPTSLVSTSSTVPSTTTTTTQTTIAGTTSTVATLHQWGQIDGLIACPDYLEALITNDQPGELRLTSVYIYFPDQPDWWDLAAWWDDPERLLPSVAAGQSAVWRVTPTDVDRENKFAPGDYRVMIITEINPDPDNDDPPPWTLSSESSFVDGTLPSPLCD